MNKSPRVVDRTMHPASVKNLQPNGAKHIHEIDFSLLVDLANNSADSLVFM